MTTQPAVDVAVIGLGAMGSAALHHLARRGVRVAGFDRLPTPHALGSTHGRSRIIREAYFEDPRYVPLVQRAYELWALLEREIGRPLFRATGGLMIGPEHGRLVAGASRSAAVHRLPAELLSAREAMRRFPVFSIPETFVALHEPRAGVLDPEGCVSAHLELATRDGALVVASAVRHWRADASDVTVTTADGAYRARQLIVAAGAWMPALVPALAPHLRIERQVMHWFAPHRATPVGPEECPIAMFEYAPGRYFYTLPDTGAGLKAAIHHEGEITSATEVRRAVNAGEVSEVAGLLERFIPAAAGAHRESAVCLYTNTPDENFVIDHHPDHERVVLVSACSGHGFKFASAIGEIVADLAQGRAAELDLSPFRLARLTAAVPSSRGSGLSDPRV